MKAANKFILLFCLFTILWIGHDHMTLTSAEKTQTSEFGFDKVPKKQRIDLAIAEEVEKTKDPELNLVPRERLIQAKKEAEQIAQQLAGREGPIANVDWTERGPNNVAGRTRALLVDAADATGATVYAGSVGGGLWKTTNINATNPGWVAIDDNFNNLAVTSIVQDPTNPSIMYFGTGEGFYNGDAIRGAGIWKSTDGGATWSNLASTSNPDFYHTQKLLINGMGNLFACTRAAGVQYSVNGGTSWTQILGGGLGGANSVRAADIEMAANGDIYAAMGMFSTDGIYKTTNNGVSWTPMFNGLPTTGYERIEVSCAPSDANVVYALFQDESNRAVSGIYKTVDGGANWLSLTVPGAVGMGNFARNQAWYDLISAVHPTDPDRVFIGGIDILMSTDGGLTWTQITQWYGGNGIQYAHADQHGMFYDPTDVNTMYFTNDGGVFQTNDANAALPTVTERNFGYNVTQFYACDIHPGAQVDYFLAGSQDNGSHQYNGPGMNSTVEITGGDGMFTHIDQDNPDIQITSYVYNSYWITGNNWANNDRINIGSGSGRFVNPTDYDDANNVLYCAYDTGMYALITDVGGNNNTATRMVSEFANLEASAVRVSPNTANRVFFGLPNGDVVRVDNATANSPTASIIRNGTGYVSCVEVEIGDDDHILVTYSNYGVTSIYETTNGGTSWNSVEGNLPDMPVRWAKFAPTSSDQALIATELGVWTTDDLNGGSTQWGPSNTGLANVRTDMIKWRTSDNTVIAATHGRGLFSSSSFSVNTVSFNTTTASVQEDLISGQEPGPANCQGLGYLDVNVELSILDDPSIPVNVDVVVDPASTATNGEDFTAQASQTVTFSPGGPMTQSVQLRVMDDRNDEGNETVQLTLNVTNSTASSVLNGINNEYKLTILDDEISPVATGSADVQIGNGTDEVWWSTPFRGGFEDQKLQYIYLASELQAAGIVGGNINALSYFISDKRSSIPYENYSIRIGHTSLTAFADSFETLVPLTDVYLNTYTTVADWNKLDFHTPFYYDGTSNLLIEICYDNDSETSSDYGYVESVGFDAVVYTRGNGLKGCQEQESGWMTDERPNVIFSMENDAEIQTSINPTVDEQTLGPNETVHFFDNTTGRIMATIVNGSHDYGCTKVEVSRAAYNTGAAPFWNGNTSNYVADKTFLVTPENNSPGASGDYDITLYYYDDEMTQWEAITGQTLGAAEMVFAPDNKIEDVNASSPTSIINSIVTATPAYNMFGTVGHTYTGTFNGGGGLGIGNVGVYSSTTGLFQTLEATIFPNPTNAGFQLSFGKVPNMNGTIELIALNGKHLQTLHTGKLNQASMDFDIATFPSGMYLIQLKLEDGRESSTRLIKM